MNPDLTHPKGKYCRCNTLRIGNYFRFESALMHLVQALTLLPEGNFAHCKLGYFLFLIVGLYFPRSFTCFQTTTYFFPQIVHCLDIPSSRNSTKLIFTLLPSSSRISLLGMLKLCYHKKMLLTIFVLIVLLFSIVIHEIGHGSMAFLLGDPTAKNEGRLTLNPLKHLDPMGSVILPLFLLIVTFGRGPIFGWAKPVPINPYNFRDQKWGTIKVSLAGPAMNFLIAIIFSLIIRFFPLVQSLSLLFSIIALYNFTWGIFNLIPIPPLDGSHILFSFLGDRFLNFKIFLKQYGTFILLFFIFFGLHWVFLLAQILYYLIIGQPFAV